MKTRKRIRKIAFFGDSTAKPEDQHYQDAWKTAKLAAEKGYGVINGGGSGVMEAATLGAKRGGGKVEIVVLDEAYKPGNFEGECLPNLRAADKVIKMKDYQKRLAKLVDIADAFIIFKGGTGTLAEVGLVWSLAKFDYGNHEPLIFFGDCWKNIIKAIVEGLSLEEIEKKVYQLVAKPEEAIKAAGNGGVLVKAKKQ